MSTSKENEKKREGESSFCSMLAAVTDSCLFQGQNHLKTIPNLLSLCVIILSFLALLHFSYRHVLFQLSF
ncbi:unnamed protein product, partial [Musa acuminata subsp. burmannicoides]